MRDLGLRLYVAQATGWEVHVAGRHPLNTGGIDVRMPADPTGGAYPTASE